ncbi:hypothetical protein EES43_24385 [Streptomyces sp. ADI96-02]|uniref:DUF6907 domain-containing protein n=1 Tax=Streptomyces sp. ADI96-02 TaxID=1522760 RepID=UPI000F54E48D|nr:hypothetical protein [Streptomyces sp. ADI96-02]RPK56183.1 hypothetical protein EES43_24385 [Streptomyces sp. ADI96-02]
MTTLLPGSVDAPEGDTHAAHPTLCPAWCRESHQAAACATMRMTVHLSAEHSVANPDPLDGDVADALIKAQLLKIDRTPDDDTLVMYLSGETDAEVDKNGADILIAQMQAFVDTLRVLRRQMDAI